MFKRRLVSLILLFVFSTQGVWAMGFNDSLVTSSEVEFENSIKRIEMEIDLDLNEVKLERDAKKAEEKALKKIHRKLEKNLKSIEKTAYGLIRDSQYYANPEFYLKDVLGYRYIDSGSVLDSVGAEDLIDSILSQNGSMKAGLLKLTTESFKQQMRDQVAEEIKKVGSAVEYLKTLKIQTGKVLCIFRNIGIGVGVVVSASAVIGTFGLGLAVALGAEALGALFFPAFGVFVGLSVGTVLATQYQYEFLSSAEASCNLRKRK